MVVLKCLSYFYSLKCFRRWVTETSIYCPQAKSDKNEVYLFTFYEDVVEVSYQCFNTVKSNSFIAKF